MQSQSDLLTGSLMIRDPAMCLVCYLAATKEQWDKAIVQNNVLQKQTVSAAQRITRGLRRRLEKLEPDLLKAIELGDDG